MIKRMKNAALLVGLMILAGCGGANTRYAWNNYDSELYNHYKVPAQREEFIVAMKEIVTDAEAENKVPPGIYAEYGYLMYEKGDMEQAVIYYQKEASKWPESKFLMEKMIANTQKRADKKGDVFKASAKQAPAVEPAPAPAVAATTKTPTWTNAQGEMGKVEVLK
jgi:hypothetical protein